MEMLTKNNNISFKDINLSKKEVAGYFSSFGDIDSYNEITNKGAFTKTIAENGPLGKNLIKWCLNHYMEQPLGAFMVLKEDDFGLFYQGVLGEMKDAKELRHMIDCGINITHSYGYRTIKEETREDGVNVLYEVKMYEGSCLSTWAANTNTPLIPVVSSSEKSIMEQVEAFMETINPYVKYKSVSEAKDEDLQALESWIDMQKKSFYDGLVTAKETQDTFGGATVTTGLIETSNFLIDLGSGEYAGSDLSNVSVAIELLKLKMKL